MSDAGKTALSIAGHLRRLDPGALAALRRMGDDGAAPAYWRLAARHDDLARRPATWAPFVRAVAILTPKGPPENRTDLHEPGHKLGQVLCDAGDADWPGAGSPRPLLSERRLAQLLAARGAQRGVLLTRAVRALAARKPARAGLDVVDLAWAFLNPGNAEAVAVPYYRRLDRGERAAAKADTSKDVQNA